MKKAFDQSVRELKREVNKKVLKVPNVEQKILDATSNEAWGPHGQLLSDVAQASRNFHEYQIIMAVIWKRINDTGRNWRHVYKALIVLDYLVAHGSDRIIDEIREHAYQISTLSDFQYIDSAGKDQGGNVRRKSQSLVALVNDKERIQEVKQKALATKDKYRSPYSTGGTNKSGSYSNNGSYGGDRYDDDRSEGRYGGRDEDRSGYGRDKNWGYRDDDRSGRGDSYGRDGDRYGRGSDEQYGRDSYRDDDSRGGRWNEEQFGSRTRTSDREKDNSFDDADNYSSRSGSGGGGGGGRTDEAFQDERRPESKLPEQNVGALPSYEEATNGRDGVTMATPAPKASSPPANKAGSPFESTIQSTNLAAAGVFASAKSKEINEFDEFDPRGFVSAAPTASVTSETDLFKTLSPDSADYLALVPISSGTFNSETDMTTNFVPVSSATTAMNQPTNDPFGDSPFKATPQQGFPVQPSQSFAPASFHPSGSIASSVPMAPMTQTIPGFDFGDSLGGLTYTPASSLQVPYVNSASLAPMLPVTNASDDVLNMRGGHQTGAPAFYSSQEPQPSAQTNLLQASSMNIPSVSGLSGAPQATVSTSTGLVTKNQPTKDNFETKSTVWADTLSRGLVNLNISGSKINPLADIGIDFDSINRMEKRKEEKKTLSSAASPSNVTMGKAMGAGSGMGAGRGIAFVGYGGSMNQPMSMNMGMGMGIGMGQGQTARPVGMLSPSPGMAGYNPTMGMSGYSPQQPYGGGYR